MLSLTLPAKPEAAAVARRHVKGLPLEPETLDTVALLVTELITNAMRHAAVPAGHEIQVRVASDDRSVRVDVVNQGPGFEWEGPERGPAEPGGLGLVLVDRLADRWGIVGGEATRVWLEVRRGRDMLGPRAAG